MPKAWFTNKGSFQTRDLETVTLASDEVRIAVEAVCLVPEHFAMACAPGGGAYGVVVECGEAASAHQGSRVLVSAAGGCDQCATCRRGFTTVCPTQQVRGRDINGGCAQQIVALGRWLTPLGNGLELDSQTAACVAGPALDAYALFCRSGASAGDIAVIVGPGPVAAILAKLAQSRGVRVVRDNSAKGGDIADTLAALEILDGGKGPQILFACGGAPTGAGVGASSLGRAIAIASEGSRIISNQQADVSDTLDLRKLLSHELTLSSLKYGHPDLLPELAALVAKGEFPLDEFVKVAPLSEQTPEQASTAFAAGACLVATHE